jgi:hypothetical protein
MENSTMQETAENVSPVTIKTNGGQFAGITAHESKADRKLADAGTISKAPKRNRQYRVATQAVKRQIDHDREALNRITAPDVFLMVKGTVDDRGIPLTVISAALQKMDQKLQAREQGTSKGGRPLVSEAVAIAENGKTIIRAVQHQKTGQWSLQLCNVEQCGSRIVNMTNREIDTYNAEMARETARLNQGCFDRALIQAEKWMAQEVKTQSLSNVCALINKVIPRVRVPIRDFTLIGYDGSAPCEGVSIGRAQVSNPIKIVAAYRPDLLPLFSE